MTKPKNNQPCPCGSGAKFKLCCKRQTSAATNLAIERRRYAREWASSSSGYALDGHYEWMAAQLGEDPGSVLEAGAGSGMAARALAEAGHAVVAVESNPRCLGVAEKTLRKAGCLARFVPRPPQTKFRGSSYSVAYSTVASDVGMPDRGKVLLIEGDLLADQQLLSWLIQLTAFDAVTSWNNGTHGARPELAQLEAWVRLPGDYRRRMWMAVHVLAESILRRGGLLHIVQRGQRPDGKVSPGILKEMRELGAPAHIETQEEMISWDMVRAQGEIASRHSSLVVDPDSVKWRAYKERGDMSYGATQRGQFGDLSSEVVLAFWSLVARKP